jgi:hypothetical protein
MTLIKIWRAFRTFDQCHYFVDRGVRNRSDKHSTFPYSAKRKYDRTEMTT